MSNLVTRCLLRRSGLSGSIPGPLSKLTPRPPRRGFGEPILSGGSTLAGLRIDFAGTGGGEAYSRGSAGTGGASSSCMIDEFLPFGEGSLNVRSVIEPELFFRCNSAGRALTLPVEETDPCRCTMRFVCISPTGVGVVVWERSAAAAAALESCVFEALLARKACAAAVEAAALGGEWRG